MKNEEQTEELLIAKALDALSASDEKTLQQLLLENPELNANLDDLREIVGLLALSAPVAEPSAKVRENILALIKEDKEVDGLFDNIVEPEVGSKIHVPAAEFKADVKSKTENVVENVATLRRSSWSVVQKMVAVAACVSVAFLGFSLWKVRKEVDISNAEIAQLKQKLESTQSELAKASELLTPETVSASLAGLEDAPQAKAKLIYDKATGKSYLVVEGLPVAPQGKAYQLWFIASKTPVSGGVFKANAQGKGELRGEIPVNERQASTVFAVTLEPEQGVPAPTGKMYLKTSL
jgi:cell division protein FtsL